MEQAYAVIGRAVIAMQIFEVAFVSIHEGFEMITDPVYLQATGRMIDEGRPVLEAARQDTGLAAVPKTERSL
jgi:hypothetical protein